MKKTLSLFFMLAFAISIANAQRTYVLATGVSRYQDETNNLRMTTRDAKAFKAVMEHQTKDISILTSKYANRDNVLQKLRTICKQATSKDRVVFYFSGHGFPGGIVAYDNVIYYNDITDILSSSAAKDKIVYVDACHAGSVAAKSVNGNYNVLKKAAGSDNIICFMSCRSDEVSSENVWAGEGYFTQSLLKGLRGKADANGDKAITVIELFNYIYKDVLHSTEKLPHPQHPQLIAPRSCHNNIVMQW